MISWRTKVAALKAIVVRIREHLEPAGYAVKHDQAYANIATTSGVEKDQTTRHRPPAQQHRSHAPSPATGPVQTLPCAEEGELAEASRYVGSDTHEKQDEPKPYTPEAGRQQLANDPSATMRTAFWRRPPFCYLLAALGLLFISSSSAVGIYYSITKNAMGDGFTTAGYMLAVGTLVVTPPAAYHYQHCRCWRRNSKSASPEGEV